MKIAVTDATFGSTTATMPPSTERTLAIVSQRRVRVSSSAASAVGSSWWRTWPTARVPCSPG